jgi:hypothetical protein
VKKGKDMTQDITICESGQAGDMPESWMLTRSEIEALERDITQSTRAAPKPGKAYEIRIQKIEIVAIRVTARNADEAGEKAIQTIKNVPELADILRSEFGHCTTEELAQ